MYNNKDSQNTFAVYCHYFPNGKVYVGLTCHCDNIEEKRFGYKGGKYKKQPLVYRAIQKYGWDNIQHEIIARYVNRESAINIEKELIQLYHSNEREHGYNISPGGEEGSYHSEESRKKMSEQRKGKKKSEEHKRKIGNAHKGRKLSDEFRKKLSDAAKNRKRYDTNKDPRNIPVLQYSIDDGEYIEKYVSISSAARKTGLNKKHISECAHEKRRQEGGYVWIFEKMASEEYVEKRLDNVRLHQLFKPVAISMNNDFVDIRYFITGKQASDYIGCAETSISGHAKSGKPINGYYIKRISVDEYLSNV